MIKSVFSGNSDETTIKHSNDFVQLSLIEKNFIDSFESIGIF